ncbi:hypothetical protein HAX54_035676, partial [Datura stramonium]|nr:hypothetical protein [Datura stramonium]
MDCHPLEADADIGERKKEEKRTLHQLVLSKGKSTRGNMRIEIQMGPIRITIPMLEINLKETNTLRKERMTKEKIRSKICYLMRIPQNTASAL